MIYIVLPAYNEGEAIGPLLDNIRGVMARVPLSHEDYRVLVIDDGSKDNTAAVATTYNTQMPVEVITHEHNGGVDAAFRTGYGLACEMAHPDDIIISMDADNTHEASDIPEMLTKLKEGYDVVIASRFMKGSAVFGVPFYRRFLSAAARYTLSFCVPVKGARDYTIFFRAYRASILQEGFAVYGKRLIEAKGFTCMAELLVKLSRMAGKRFRVAEVPCTLRYNQKPGASKMRVIRNILQYVIMIVRTIFLLKRESAGGLQQLTGHNQEDCGKKV
jgi:dolichol-phosphate mannosyltransferase